MSSDSMPARIPRLGWAIAFLVAAAVIAFAYVNFQPKRSPASRMDKYAPAPEFKLTDQYGKTVTNADLKGKVWVADFIFTRCPGPCPVMTSNLASLNKALGNRKDVELVTITVDPEFDTPEVLKKYGERAGATPERWKFLTGPKEQLDTVITKGFLQALGKDADGMPMHSTRFVLVDRNGWIRGFPESTGNPNLIPKLLTDIDELSREPQSGAQK